MRWSVACGFLLMGCSEPEAEIEMMSIEPTPLEVDTVPESTTPYYAEEVEVTVKSDMSDYFLENWQPEVTLTSYTVQYDLWNESGDVPPYENGLQIYVEPDTEWQFPVRAVSFIQKDWIADVYGPTATVNAIARLTILGVDQLGNEYTLVGDYDIIFADFIGN